MIRQRESVLRQIKQLIRQGKLTMAGNLSLKIYGTFSCSSGKRMKTEHRVFFKNETEAIQLGFRPCGHCLHGEYLRWKSVHKESN